MKKIVFLFVVMFLGISLFAQNTKNADSLKVELSATKTEIEKLQAKVNSIRDEINDLPGWKLGASGTIGVNLAHFNNWYSNQKPNLSEGHINIIQTGYAKIMKKKYFWINHATLHLFWERSYNKNKDAEDKGFVAKIDMFKLSSVFGYRVFERFALAAVTDYRGSFIKDVDAPSFWDFGLGVSWKPISNFYLVATPLSYEFILSSKEGENDYHSSGGAKFLADYTRTAGKFNIKSNLITFISYKNMNYSNWVWTNSLSYTLWKKIGIGLNLGLGQNKQEVFNSLLNNYPTLKNTDNQLQHFWVLGISYAI